MKTLISAPTGYSIRATDLRDADEALADRVVAFTHLMDREAVPEDPSMPAPAIKARLRNRSRFGERVDHLAFRGDELVGRVAVFQNKTAINDRMGFREAWWGDIWQISLDDARRSAGL